MLLAIIFVPLILQYGIKPVAICTVGVLFLIIWVILATMLIARSLDWIEKR